jgi:hypothetical protein
MTTQLFFLPFLSIEQKNLFGENRPFMAPSNSVQKKKEIYTNYDYTRGEYYYYDVYEIIKPMKLSTHWDCCARPFLQDKIIDLPVGTLVYLIPEGNPIFRTERWKHFEVNIKE